MKKRKVDDGLFEKEVEVLSPEEEAQRKKKRAWFVEQCPELAGSATLGGGPQYFRGLKNIMQRVKDALLFVNGAAVHGPVYRYAIPENYPEGPHREHDLDLVDRLLAALEKHQPGDCGSAYRIGMLNGELRARLDSHHVQRGRKVKKAASIGHTTTHGTSGEKEARWADYKATYAAKKAGNPYLLHEDLCRHTAKEHGVSIKTIKRHCPRK